MSGISFPPLLGAGEMIHSRLLAAEECGMRFPQVAKRAIQQAEDYARQARDHLTFAHFLERLDPQLLDTLSLHTLSSYRTEIRSIFDLALNKIKEDSPQEKPPTCFICFNVDDHDVKQWVLKVLVPDLKTLGVIPTYSPIDLLVGDDLSKLEAQAGTADFALVLCTPGLKKKCAEKLDSGVAREIALIKNRPEGTTIPLCFKGSGETSLPPELSTTIFRISVMPYWYYPILRAFSKLRGYKENKEDAWMRIIEKQAEELLSRYCAPPPVYPSAPPQPYVVSDKVPPQNQHFVPRRSVSLERAFRQSNVVVLTQSPAVLSRTGKTQIAIDYARRSAFQYEKVLWMDARDLEENTCAQPNTLIVLDDIPNLPPHVYAHARSHILITSQNPNWGSAAVVFVPPFSDEEALDLLQLTSNCFDQEERALQIVRSVGNIPSFVEGIGKELLETQTPLETYTIILQQRLEWKKQLLATKGNVPLPEGYGNRWHEIEYYREWFRRKKGPLFLSIPEATLLTQQYALFNAAKYDFLHYLSKPDDLSNHQVQGKNSLLIVDNVHDPHAIPILQCDCIVIAPSPSKNFPTEWKSLFPLIEKKEKERNFCPQPVVIPLLHFMALFSPVEKTLIYTYLQKNFFIPQDEAEEVLLLALNILDPFFPIERTEDTITLKRNSACLHPPFR